MEVLKQNIEYNPNGSVKPVILDDFRRMLGIGELDFEKILQELDTPKFAFEIRFSPCPSWMASGKLYEINGKLKYYVRLIEEV